MDIEYEILKDIYARSSFQEQMNLIVELNNQDFKSEKNFDIFKVFNNILLKRIKIDPISFYEMDKRLAIDNADLGNSEYISESECLSRIKQLKERNYRTDIRNKAQNWITDLNKENDTDKFDEIKNSMIIGLSSTDLDTGSKFINPVEITQKIDENMKKDAGLEGYTWGLTDLDYFTSGIVVPRMIVIGGLKKTGKSRFIINTRFHLYQKKIPSVFLSLEMPPYEVTKLTYSRFAGVPDTHFRSIGYMQPDEKNSYEKVKRELDWNLLPTECINSVSVNQVLQRIRMYSRIYKNPIIFIDYLQRIKHDRNKQATELEQISNAIADATRNYGVSIILLAQLANIAEREEPNIGHLKGSGGIGEASDCIILLDNIFRRTKNDKDKGKFKIVIDQRYGDSGIIKIMSDLGTSTFCDSVETYPAVKSDYYKDENLDL